MKTVNHKFIPLIDNTFEILIIKYFICSLLGQRNLASAKAITGKLVELYCCTLTTHLIIKYFAHFIIMKIILKSNLKLPLLGSICSGPWEIQHTAQDTLHCKMSVKNEPKQITNIKITNNGDLFSLISIIVRVNEIILCSNTFNIQIFFKLERNKT